MQTLIERGCGLDVHQATVVACWLIVRGDGRGLLRKKIPKLELALEGKLEAHHRFLLQLQLQRLEAAEKDLAALEQRIQQRIEPYAAQLALLDEIPGVNWTVAIVIIAEMGVDMSVFGSVSQVAAWAGVCPGNDESAGKRKSSRIPNGNVYLKTAWVETTTLAPSTWIDSTNITGLETWFIGWNI